MYRTTPSGKHPFVLGFTDLFALLLFRLEGGAANLSQDKGGSTVYGVSSRAHPDVFNELGQMGWPLAGVEGFYRVTYFDTIYDVHRLARTNPRLIPLFFFGKVHGVGMAHYLACVQRYIHDNIMMIECDGVLGPVTAGVLHSLDEAQRKDLILYIVDNASFLASQRVKAVGAYPTGITNRVKLEVCIATSQEPIDCFEKFPSDWRAIGKRARSALDQGPSDDR